MEALQDTDLMIIGLELINLTLTSVGLVIAGVHDAFVLLFYVNNLGVAAVNYAWANFMQFFYNQMVNMYELIDNIPFVNMTQEIREAEQASKEWGEKIEEVHN